MLESVGLRETIEPEYDLATLRAQFPHTQSSNYLNHASISPTSTPMRQAQIDMIDTMGAGSKWFESSAGQEFYPSLYASIAQMINAQPDEVGLVQNTSFGLNLIAQGLTLPADCNIIICDVEFPSNVYPWMNLARQRGLELRRIPADNGGLTVAALNRHADDKTALVSVSSLQYLTGHRSDLNALGAWCAEHNVLFCVDSIQSAAHWPIDVKAAQIDFLATGGMKSLMGPMGSGFMYMRRERLAEHDAPMVGGASVTEYKNWTHIHFDLRPEVARYELGVPNIVGHAGLKASITLLVGLGITNIDRWTVYLARVLMDDLTRRGYRLVTPATDHGNIVTWETPKLEADLASLDAAGISVSERGGYIRASVHCYNNIAEVLAVGETVGDV